MTLRQRITHTALAISLAFSGLAMSPTSFAHGHDHHHDCDHHWHHHARDGLIAGLAAGAIIGGIAIAASNSNTTTYYGPRCRRVVYQRRCHFNRWGDRICRQQRIRYRC